MVRSGPCGDWAIREAGWSALTIVGIAPADFRGTWVPMPNVMDVWLPLGMIDEVESFRYPKFRFPWTNPERNSLRVYGRLRETSAAGPAGAIRR
jgi:hypothetical protein